LNPAFGGQAACNGHINPRRTIETMRKSKVGDQTGAPTDSVAAAKLEFQEEALDPVGPTEHISGVAGQDGL
jgi:hypothetical protein